MRRHEYTEDDPIDDELSERAVNHLRDFEVLIDEGPDFGTFDDRRDTAEMVVAIPADAVKRLCPKHISRLLRTGRLPAAWVEEVKEGVLHSRGWSLKTYRRVHLDHKQRRLSDTDGGYPAIGYLRVTLVVGMDRGADMEASA